VSYEWCPQCCTQHRAGELCPGELLATGAERHAWRVNVDTPHGVEAYAVLIAESHDRWRARILTYPNVLWLVPRGSGTVKFASATPQEAEAQAIEFIKEHCARRGFKLRVQETRAEPTTIDPESAIEGLDRPDKLAPRKIRFIPVRFGIAGLTERGGIGNLSETGLFIITNAPVDCGKRLHVSVGIDGHDMPLTGLVRWMRKAHHVGRAPGMGVQISDPPLGYVDYVRCLP